MAEMVVLCFMSALAPLTPLALLAQTQGLTFNAYCLWGGVLSMVCALIAACVSLARLSGSRDRDTGVLLTLAVLGLLTAGLAVMTHRPDIDDYHYVPSVVHCMQNPSAPMGFQAHFYVSSGLPLVLHGQGTSVAYDYARGVLAAWMGVDYLSVYYLVSLAVAAFLLPVVLFVVASRFCSESRHALVGAAVSVALLLLLRETHRTWGNMCLPRMFQGKAVLMSVGMPAFAAFSLSYLRRPSWYDWFGLCAIGMAMAGTTNTSVILLPGLAGVLMVSVVVAEPRAVFARGGRTRAIGILLSYLFQLGYLVAYAVYLLIHLDVDTGVNSPINDGWPQTFVGHASYFLDRRLPLTPIACVALPVFVFSFLRGERRVFLLSWTAAVVGLFLNPVVAPLLIRYVVTPNIYWRLFYLYPLAVLAAALGAEISRRLTDTYSFRLSATVSISLLAFVCGAYLGWRGDVRGMTWIGWPVPKLPPGELAIARRVAAVSPAGRMLAPISISGIIPMVSSGRPQIVLRADTAMVWLPDEAPMRLGAAAFAAGDAAQIGAFEALVSAGFTDVAVLDQSVYSLPETLAFLRLHRMDHVRFTDGFAVVSRSGTQPPSR